MGKMKEIYTDTAELVVRNAMRMDELAGDPCRTEAIDRVAVLSEVASEQGWVSPTEASIAKHLIEDFLGFVADSDLATTGLERAARILGGGE